VWRLETRDSERTGSRTAGSSPALTTIKSTHYLNDFLHQNQRFPVFRASCIIAVGTRLKDDSISRNWFKAYTHIQTQEVRST
jgi:hypothetical protein